MIPDGLQIVEQVAAHPSHPISDELTLLMFVIVSIADNLLKSIVLLEE